MAGLVWGLDWGCGVGDFWCGAGEGVFGGTVGIPGEGVVGGVRGVCCME